MNNNQNPQDGDEEQDLTRQLEETQSQLSLINAQCNLDPTNPDFAELKSNLEELRKLLEDELLKIKKVKLLAELGIETEECPVTVDSQQEQNTEVKPENLEQESDESAVDLICQFNGLECSVPYQLQNGQIEFHDAILQVEEQSVDDLLEQVKFKAYFLYPTMSSMLTCQYYLKDNCRFTNGSCRYSHGVEVTLEQIRSKHAISLEDESTDLTRLQGKQVKCLVRNHPAEVDPNLWARGVVCQIEPSKGDQPVLVKFDDASKTENWLSLDRLVILEANDVEEANDDEVQLESFAEMAPVPVEHSSANFGEWERFTKGIGSKLLAKMGYQPGSGLGVSGQGIVDPIEPIVFPPGRSLDHCIALKHKHDRKKTDLKEILKEKAKKLKLEKKLAAGYRRENNRLTGKSVFNFLNHQIFGSLDRTHRKSKTSSSGHGKKEFAHINSKTDSKSLNLSSFQVSEDLRKAEAELRKCEDSYRRNTGENHRQDKAVVKHLEEKLSNQRDRVAYLKRKQSAIHREKQIRSDKDKLRFF